jgi:uncharacterized protein YcbX
MPAVIALYRYPVKGLTPEECKTLTVLSEGRIAGDRVLAFRFANSQLPDAAWSRKHECVVLMTAFSQKEPTFAVGMVTRGAGGEVRVGDEVSLVEG